jgi:hypothetical protein
MTRAVRIGNASALYTGGYRPAGMADAVRAVVAGAGVGEYLQTLCTDVPDKLVS